MFGRELMSPVDLVFGPPPEPEVEGGPKIDYLRRLQGGYVVILRGVSEYLSTEMCTSQQKRFSLVTFVDTPGLVDGYMQYPFDVDQAILWLGL
ncbi:hypothetical protein AAFF_G00050510 [Aldrovandia affinis]|uniref:Uncharacterized protein n=1 Tax=Aldrovandia affinis TaxID=143900 RepID=A0AAD7T4D4_9TELE|nr:hypothetical protein AAFF_G00050510 [Aldrovandia affinis]